VPEQLVTDPPAIDPIDEPPGRPRRTARYAAAAVGVVLVALIALFALSGPSDDDASSPLIGTRVPALSGVTMDVNGQGIDSFDIDDWRGSWVVVNFFATWCPPCVAEHDDLVTVSEWGAGDGPGRAAVGAETRVVSVVFNDTEEQVGAFFAQRGGDWPVVNNAQAAIDFRVAQVPESFVIAPDGTVVSHLRGEITADELIGLITQASGAAAADGNESGIEQGSEEDGGG
jgi:cytochrome c biogenesis protein CcmG/thiol:disulfide interchange protein DsbE